MIRNREDLGGSPARDAALACVAAGVEAATPDRIVADRLSLEGDRLRVGDARYDLSEYDRVVLVGGGKATAGLADGIASLLGDRLDGGAIVVPDPADVPGVEVVVGDHPVPSERGVEGARRVLSLAEEADAGTLVLAVVTGGGSALLAAPAESIPLADLRSTTDALLDSGADIGEINAVRKHLSAIKGGGLARAAAPATVAGVIVSDVVGDDLSVIASGPTAPDDSTFGDALAVLDRYGIDAPETVRKRLERGRDGEIAETPGTGNPAFDRARNHVLASGFTALDAAREVAEDRGYDACVLSSRVRGEARESAQTHVAVPEEIRATGNPIEPPAVVLSGGETTVTVRGDGVGGPNLEFALSAAIELAEGDADEGAGGDETAGEDADEGDREPRVVAAAVDTDGRDGSTDAAGTIVDARTATDLDAARAALADNDAHTFLAERSAVIDTGPTGTNVNDLRVLVVEGADDALEEAD